MTDLLTDLTNATEMSSPSRTVRPLRLDRGFLNATSRHGGSVGEAPNLFRCQPITPQRRLAGCDAAALITGAPVERPVNMPSGRPDVVAGMEAAWGKRPASLSFSWAAAGQQVSETRNLKTSWSSRVTGLTNARYADGRSAPTRVPQSFSPVAA